MFLLSPFFNRAVLTALLVCANMQATEANCEIDRTKSSIKAEGPGSQLTEQNHKPSYWKVKSPNKQLPKALAGILRMSAREKENSTWNYVGNNQSLKFHKASCEFACMMAASRRIRFQFCQQAIETGMKPCNWCLPQWSTHVEGEIMTGAPAETSGVQGKETEE